MSIGSKALRYFALHGRWPKWAPKWARRGASSPAGTGADVATTPDGFPIATSAPPGAGPIVVKREEPIKLVEKRPSVEPDKKVVPPSSKEFERQLAAEIEDKGSVRAAVAEINRQFDLSLSAETKRQLAAEIEDKGSVKAAVKELQRQYDEAEALERLAEKPPARRVTEAEAFEIIAEKPPELQIDVVKSFKRALAKSGKEWGEKLEPIKNTTTSVWRGLTPWKEEKGEVVTKAGVALMAAELIVPGVFVANRWDELSPGEKAAYLALDVVSLVPLAGAAVREARMVATAGRLARVAGAAKGVGKEVVIMVRAPVDMVIHPVGAVKSTAREIRSLAENIAHPRRIPEAVITTSEGTIRLKITKNTTPEQAILFRDQLMELAAKGERPIVKIGDQTIELSRSPLMRETKGGVVHGTPSGEAFEKGLKVATKEGMPLSEQGLFVANEPLPRFTEASAFGKTGERSTVVIMNGETAAKAVRTGKVYNSPIGRVAEMELKLPVGTKIPEPVQKLFTRIGPSSHRMEIWLEKPLSFRQIAKLKAEGILEAIKAPFKPAITIKGKGAIKGLTNKQARALEKVLKQSGNIEQAANLARATRVAGGVRRAAPALNRVISRAVFRRTLADRAPRTTRVPPREAFARAERARAEKKRPPERTRAESDRAERARARGERALPARGERARPERERPERERPERERPERERPERERPERERPERERPERERPERERPERERPRPERERPPRRPPERPPRRPPPIPPSGASDKQKREHIRRSTGATTWNMGKLHEKDVWHVRFDDGEHIVVLGKAPAGARILADGPGSATKTAQRIGPRRGFGEITQQHGAVRATLKPSGRPKGVDIRFQSHKVGGQYYTPMGGAIAISRRPLGRRRRR